MPGLVIAWIVTWILTGLLQASANQQLSRAGNETTVSGVTTALSRGLNTDSSASGLSVLAAVLMIGYVVSVLSFTKR